MAYRKMLIGTDGSESATRALRDAAQLAKASSAELEILCVYDPPAPSEIAREVREAPEEVAWRITGSAAAEDIMATALEVATAEGVPAKSRIEPGDAAEMLIQVAEQDGCDLIIVGNKGMAGVKRFLLGSVPNKVSHHAPCDVLIAKTT